MTIQEAGERYHIPMHIHSAGILALGPVRRDKKVMGDRHRTGTAGRHQDSL